MTLRVGIIGLGSVGEVHLRAFKGFDDFTVTAAAEVDVARLNAMSAEHRFKPYIDFRQMLLQERLDIACIATPALSHEEITLACAEHGVHVLCEKPLALSVQAANNMIAACERAGVELAYGSSYRYLSPVAKARDIIASGEIGDVVLIRENYVSGSGPEEYKAMGFHHYPDGGPGGSGMGLVDHGIHMFDIFPWLAGDHIVSVIGRGNISGQVPQTEYAVMRMSRGATGVIVYNDATWSTSLPGEGAFSWGGAWDKDGYHAPGSWLADPGCIHVHGTKGALRIFHYAHRLYKFTAAGTEQVGLPMDVAPAHFAKQMQCFAAAIRSGGKIDVPAQAGSTALRWLLAAYAENAA